MVLTPAQDNERAILDILEAANRIKNDPTRFTMYADNPVGFCRDVLGVTLWSKQKKAMRMVAKKKPGREGPNLVAVRSGHSVGKTFLSACIVIWWLYARQGRVFTTGPTKEHVEDVLWTTIHDIKRNAKVYLPGEWITTDIKVTKDWYATGITTSVASAFQGRHHPRLLALVDEAPGVEDQIHLELSTLATGEDNAIVYIGNPTLTSGAFYDAFSHPDDWQLLAISCLDHPNVRRGKEIIKGAVTRGWVNDMRRKWGEEHPFWFSRVLGDFPKISERGAIPLGYVEQQTDERGWIAALRKAEAENIPRVGGLDVARYGANQSVLTIRRGDAIEDQIPWHHQTLMETAGRALRAIEEYDLKTLVIDASGIGAGVYDRMLELGAPVIAYNGGHRAFTSASYTNRRTEMWWHTRQRFEKGRIWLRPNLVDTPGNQLVRNLVAPMYEVNSSGRIKLESKEDLMSRGEPSPDWADSLILSLATEEDPEAELEPRPGPRQDEDVFEELHPIEPQSEYAQFPEGF